jgi:hypothetical protein
MIKAKQVNRLPQGHYGKCTLGDLKQIVNLIPLLQELSSEMFSLVTQKPERLRELVGKNFYWSAIYQCSLLEQATLCLASTGNLEKIIKLSQASENANSKVLEFIQDDSHIDTVENDLTDEQIKTLFVTSYSLLKTVESIQSHGQSINQLVRQVQDTDNRNRDKALFKIIEIDHSAISCPCIADRIALAEIEQDKKFFKSLQKAFNGPHKTKQSNHRELRYLLEILDEDGTLDSLSMEQCYQLCCVDLDLYPIEGSDPAKSLDQFIRRWKKERST